MNYIDEFLKLADWCLSRLGPTLSVLLLIAFLIWWDGRKQKKNKKNPVIHDKNLSDKLTQIETKVDKIQTTIESDHKEIKTTGYQNLNLNRSTDDNVKETKKNVGEIHMNMLVQEKVEEINKNKTP